MPMLIRKSVRSNNPTHIFVPSEVIHRLREFIQLSFSMKIDYNDDLPLRYCPPCVTSPVDGVIFETWEEHSHHWHPVSPLTCIPLALGKSKNKTFCVHTVHMQHRCSCVGYIIQRKKLKILAKYLSTDKRVAAQNIQTAKASGENVHYEHSQTIIAFLCDTSIEALSGEGPHIDQIFSSPVVMVECTYLHEDMLGEANKRGHITWGNSLSIIVQNALSNAKVTRETKCDNPTSETVNTTPDSYTVNTTPDSYTFILMHFSLRYKDEEIVDFFLTNSGMGEIRYCTNSRSKGDAQSRPLTAPHVILWLDSGIQELWFSNFI